ncbi:MAG: hypothetical protein OEY67_00355 [Gammaproteobacteria bacterium]|nr:hypothetical protein [Gammaproteobacteria bacterium]
MNLEIIIEDRRKTLNVPDEIMAEAEAFFDKMDRDMDRGWQMGPEFIEKPDQLDRCKIAADKILIAIDTNNENLLLMMAGYILSRMPGVTGINIDTQGEMQNTEIIMGHGGRIN